MQVEPEAAAPVPAVPTQKQKMVTGPATDSSKKSTVEPAPAPAQRSSRTGRTISAPIKAGDMYICSCSSSECKNIKLESISFVVGYYFNSATAIASTQNSSVSQSVLLYIGSTTMTLNDNLPLPG